MDSVEKLLNAQAEKQNEQDDYVNDNKTLVASRTIHLLDKPEERNQALWELFEIINPGLSISVYESVEIKDRDVEWLNEYGAMLAAANYQAMMELNIVDLLNMAEKSGEQIEALGKKMTVKQLEEAGKRGVSKVRRDGVKDAR